jgi:hypothetical protein
MKKLNSPNEPAASITWVDTPIPALDWTQGVVQFGHHSMGPQASEGGGTWHWDDFTITPAVGFTIVKGTRRYADEANPTIAFAGAAPANAYLRFAGYGEKIEVSFDGGKKWEKADRQAEKLDVGDRFHSYWTPVPAGTTTVQFRAKDDQEKEKKNKDDGPWFVRNAAFWSR